MVYNSPCPRLSAVSRAGRVSCQSADILMRRCREWGGWQPTFSLITWPGLPAWAACAACLAVCLVALHRSGARRLLCCCGTLFDLKRLRPQTARRENLSCSAPHKKQDPHRIFIFKRRNLLPSRRRSRRLNRADPSSRRQGRKELMYF